MMTRALGFLGMATLFLTISPGLRHTLEDGIGSVNQAFELYAPYSYIGGFILIVLVLVMSFYRGAQPQ